MIARLLTLAMALLLAVSMSGCVRRPIAITSTPSDALVYVNDREVGRTPCDVQFLYYGVYDVRLKLDGYESVLGSGNAEAPIWDFIGADLFAELAPVNLESRVSWHFDLTPADTSPVDLLARARAMRGSVEGESPAPIAPPGTPGSEASGSTIAPVTPDDLGNQGAIPPKGSKEVPVPPTENPSGTPGSQTPPPPGR